MIDGIAGVDLATVLFDLGPEPTPIDEDLDPWVPEPDPNPVDAAERRRARAWRRRRSSVTAKALAALRTPERALAEARVAAEGVGEIVWAGLNPAPPTPLNVEIGPHRRFAGVVSELADFKAVKNAFGGTVNDVVLAVVAGALRTLAARRAACAPRASSCARSCRCRCACRTSAARRQPARGDARPAAGLGRRSRRAPRRRARGDGRPQGVQAGDRRRGPLQRAELRPADGARAGLAHQLLDAPVQPARHERARAAVPALRRGARDARRVPDRVPAQGPRAVDRDHVLQRAHELRPARRTSTRCTTSTSSRRRSRTRSPSSWRSPPRRSSALSAAVDARRQVRARGTARGCRPCRPRRV